MDCVVCCVLFFFVFFFQAEDGIRDRLVTGVQTCALPIYISMTSNLEAAKLVEQYPQMMVVPVQGGKNPTPLAVLLPQTDQVWINYVNHWIILKTERGFFDQLKAKWLKQ